MAVATSVLRSEMRRHLLTNLGLVAGLVIGGTVVTNERGLFVPLGLHGMSETAKAFSAMFTPSHLLPNFTNVKMVVPLEPFDVTADSRDLRRRLMEVADATGNPGDDAATQATQLAQNGQPLTVTELADSSTSTRKTDTPSSTGAPGQSVADAGGGVFPPSPSSIIGSSLGGNNNETPPNTTPIDAGGGTPGGGGAPVPEPSVWVMLLAGFGTVGYALRTARRRRIDGNGARVSA